MEFSLDILDVDELVPHEMYCSVHAEKLYGEIKQTSVWIKPILVASEGSVILDGHHRLVVAKRLKLGKIPCCIVNYKDPAVLVSSWREDYPVCKASVLKAALNKALLPIKTSRHLLDFEIPDVQVDLKELLSG